MLLTHRRAARRFLFDLSPRTSRRRRRRDSVRLATAKGRPHRMGMVCASTARRTHGWRDRRSWRPAGGEARWYPERGGTGFTVDGDRTTGVGTRVERAAPMPSRSTSSRSPANRASMPLAPFLEPIQQRDAKRAEHEARPCPRPQAMRIFAASALGGAAQLLVKVHLRSPPRPLREEVASATRWASATTDATSAPSGSRRPMSLLLTAGARLLGREEDEARTATRTGGPRSMLPAFGAQRARAPRGRRGGAASRLRRARPRAVA